MTSKYNPFYRTKPKMRYIPSHWGRLGEGEWVKDDNFSAPPKRESEEYLDARNLFHITTSIGDRGTNRRTDVGKLEALMHIAGVYDLDDTDGPTGYYGERLKQAVKKFQKANALRVDGDVNPDGETIRTLAQNLQDMGRRGGTVLAHLTYEEARFLRENTDNVSINPQTGLMEFYDAGKKNALTANGNGNPGTKTIRAFTQHLQDMGRGGDTVLAHLTPKEARFLHENTDGGSINPQTGLMEFNVTGNKEGSYIWHTVGDGKVRSSHAERDGQVFSWNDPPEGGHPGEAPNCRCTAEELDKPKKDCEKILRAMDATYRRHDNLQKPILDAKDDVAATKKTLKTLMEERKDIKSEMIVAGIPTNLGKITLPGAAATLALIAMLRRKLKEKDEEIVKKEQTLASQEETLADLEHKRENLRSIAEEYSRRYQACIEKNK